jgi:RecB family endonuclease NucS
MATELGTLTDVDLRQVWNDEARDFTPWLKDNIERLNQVLGLDIEITERERAVGSFAVDLVGRDLSSGRTVIIENQLEPTDHTHLGQLLTYAAGRGAKIVILVINLDLSGVS